MRASSNHAISNRIYVCACLQARVEEASDEVRGLRAEVGRVTDALLTEERKVSRVAKTMQFGTIWY